MPCGRFMRHDNKAERREFGRMVSVLFSCAGSLKAAPGPDDSQQLAIEELETVLEEIAAAAKAEALTLFA
ncbi:hypothetical protein [Streptomyces sp. CS014]|uniref:hypothetical protein n=1 Tax=Streptomyces sp. CS014 TaxID=2162707 RepID=UPI000D51724B|nr:hypothetical protein [Streptomyces sp. CS014]PVD04491.1 hypothetical protein DBP12_03435 [Streptomyces sp. CS014]